MTRDRELTLATVDALAATENVAPQELDYALHDYIDTTALDRLSAMDQTAWELTFEVEGHEVVVSGDGQICIDGCVVRDSEPVSQHGL